MDNNDNDERIMEEIIAGGANAFASYTDEEIILNMIGQEGVATDDFANEEYIAADSENNDDLEDANAKGSNEIYISCIKFISINSITPFLVYSHKFMSIHGKLLLIFVVFWIDDEKVQERSCITNCRRCDVSYHGGVRAWPACCSKKSQGQVRVSMRGNCKGQRAHQV
jgi:hypothetical protein